MPLMDSLRIDQVFSSDAASRFSTLEPVLLGRAKALAPDDRLLIELAYDKHLSVRQIARLMSRTPGAISRRMRRIRNRLHSPLVGALLDPRCTLSREYRDVGLEYFAQGVDLRELCRRRQMSLTQLRSMLDFIRGWHRGALRG